MKPRSEMHRRMLGRNLTVLAILLVFVVLVAVVTYVKMRGA